MKLTFVVLSLLLVMAVAAVIPVRPYVDFQVLFHADMGLLHGVPLYDHAGQVRMIAQFAGVPTGQVYVLPFPYPPWYALSTIWLAWIPADAAARVWFGLNLLMLATAAGLLTMGVPPVKRALVFLGAIFWLPALGSLFVGQYGFPVLLGAALMVHALEREKPLLVGIAAALLTFKPHLGLLILLLVVARFLTRRDRFSRNASLALLAAAALLFAVGFAASPRWPIEYAGSLIGFGDVHGVPECTQCVSLPVVLARLFSGGLGMAAWIALAPGALACGWLVWHWKRWMAGSRSGVSIATLATLMISPYLLNYDYLILLVPFFVLAGETLSPGEWIALALAYILPPTVLALMGTAGNPVLIISTCILLVLTLRHLTTAAHIAIPSAA